MMTDQITFQARRSGTAVTAASQSPAEAVLWRRRLDSFLQVGESLGRGYLNFGDQAAAIRWHGTARSLLPWEYAHAFVGDHAALTVVQALELPEFDPADLPAGGLNRVRVSGSGLRRDAIGALAGSADAKP